MENTANIKKVDISELKNLLNELNTPEENDFALEEAWDTYLDSEREKEAVQSGHMGDYEYMIGE